MELGLIARNPGQLLDVNFDTVIGRIALVKGKPDRGLDRSKLARAGARIAARATNSQFREPTTHGWLGTSQLFTSFTKICSHDKAE